MSNTPSAPIEVSPAAAPAPALRFGPFVLDRAAGQLLREGRPVALAPRPWQVLCFLSERPGRLVSKDELLDGVWGHRFVSESVLKVAVNTLRQALGEDAREARWVQTVPRRGYRFDGLVPVAEAPTEAPQAPVTPIGATATPAPPQAPQPPEPGRGNLPHAARPLVGRAQALAELQAAQVRHRLLTLIGPGGVGKTRLALAAAATVGPADGVWLVRLEDLDRGEAICGAVARALGLGEAAGRTPEALGQALAPLSLRLVLDNAEHLADALAPQLAAWLQRAPGLSVLVSSQRPLQIAGEQLWPVEPLALPAASADAQALRDSPAVDLMVQLVLQQRPGWSPGTDDLAELAAIATALDGLPLALELAAARVPLLGTAGVRQRLDARLRMLTGGRLDAPLRHRTLRASLEWSFSLLTPQAFSALCRLAVFAGGFTADAAQAVLAPALPDTDEWQRLDLLTQLQDLALLARPATAAGTATTVAADVPRLRLLDSVRLYGLERLAQDGQLGAAHADHRRWVLARLQAADEAYFEVGVERWLTPLAPEVDNLVAAMGRGLDSLDGRPDSPATAPSPAPAAAPDAIALATDLALLAAAATSFCLRAGLGPTLKQWRDRLDAWLQAHGVVLPSAARARWCLGGAMLGGVGLVPIREALQLGLQAVAGLADSPRRRQLALYVSGLYQQRLRETDALASTLQQMRQLPPEAAASPQVRKLLPLLEASAAQARGDRAAYLAFWLDDLAASRAQGDRFEAWRAAWGVGEAHFLSGRTDEAIAVMDPAIAEIRAAGRLHAQCGFASQALVVRLSRDAGPQTMARLHELLPVLRSQGMLFAAIGDALAWVPLGQGRLADALRVQAWADARVAAEGVVRSHVARHLRALFAQRVGDAALPEAPAPALDEDAALRLAGVGGSDGKGLTG